MLCPDDGLISEADEAQMIDRGHARKAKTRSRRLNQLRRKSFPGSSGHRASMTHLLCRRALQLARLRASGSADASAPRAWHFDLAAPNGFLRWLNDQVGGYPFTVAPLRHALLSNSSPSSKAALHLMLINAVNPQLIILGLNGLRRIDEAEAGPFTLASTRIQTPMPLWLVKATWIEDETEANEQWEVNADTAHDALREATAHFRFPPHHTEARLCMPEDPEAVASDLPPGQARRVLPQ